MKNRVATFPKRIVIVIEETGNTYHGTWDYADYASEEGTLLEKDTFLKDATVEKLGLEELDDPLVDDALDALAEHASRHAAGGADPVVQKWVRVLTVSGWAENTQDLLLPITDDNVVFIQGGTDDDKAAFAGISVAHIAEGLRFAAVSTPTVDITLNISAI